jgi:hypothetical protein
VLGVLAAEQTEGDKTIRNDRLIANPESAKIPVLYKPRCGEPFQLPLILGAQLKFGRLAEQVG